MTTEFCDRCGEATQGSHTVARGWAVCDDCLDQYAPCDECGGLFEEDELNDSPAGEICEGCMDALYRECCDCDTLTLLDDLQSASSDGRLLCQDCYDQCHHSCDRCDEIYEGDSCPDCPDGELAYYSARVTSTPLPGYRSCDAPLVGIELELEIRDGHDIRDAAEEIYDLLGPDNVILKEDGSLDYGLEIVARPMSLRQARGFWKAFQENPPASLIARETCGLHVHLDRRAMSAIEISKYIYAANSPAMVETVIVPVAGREPTRYCRAVEKRMSDYSRRGMSAAQHGEIVALCYHAPTIELRASRACRSDWTVFCARVELAVALYEWVRAAGMTEVARPEQFRAWLYANPKFRSLKALLKRAAAGTGGIASCA